MTLRHPRALYVVGPAVVAALAAGFAGIGIAVVGDPLKVAIVAVAVVASVAIVTSRPAVFLGAAVGVLATYQLSNAYPFQIGSYSVYTTDLLLVVVAARAAMPFRRSVARIGLGGAAGIACSLFLATLALAAYRGIQAGAPLELAVRDSLPVFLLPAMYFGFTAAIREDAASLESIVRVLSTVIVGFALFSLVSRAGGQTLDVGASGLAEVPIAGGTTLLRNYGFATSFLLFPVLGVCALAYSVRNDGASHVAIALAIVAIVAAFSTLERTVIFGLVAGTVVVFLLRGPPQTRARRRGFNTIIQLAGGMAIVAACAAVASPVLLSGATARALPGLTDQAPQAVANAELRQDAAGAGVAFARTNPFGVGFVPPVEARGMTRPQDAVVDSYASHSAVAWLLYYSGWPGLMLATASWVLILVRSFRARGQESWVHPAFVAVWVLILANCAGAAILEQPFVLGIAALAMAVRFGRLPDEHDARLAPRPYA